MGHSIVVWKNAFVFANGIIDSWQISTEDIKTTIAEYFKTQPVLKAWLFGSFARGEETPDSDIDILFMPYYSGIVIELIDGGL